jgi:hypothetical protein
MMRKFSVVLLCFGVSVFINRAGAAGSESPVGTWDTMIRRSGDDKGVCYLTFSEVTNAWTGYGITSKSLGPFTFNGTWLYDEKGKIVSGYVATFPGDTNGIAGYLDVKIPAAKHFRGKTKTTAGGFTLQGEPASTVPDVSGSWRAEIREGNETAVAGYNLLVSTNSPFGWFDLSGSGSILAGDFTMVGAILVSANGKAAGYYTLSGVGVTGTTTASFDGKFKSSLQKVVFKGRDQDGKRVVIRAERQLPSP